MLAGGEGRDHLVEQTYRIYEIDPALPVTFDLVGTRIHPDEAAWFQDVLRRASSEGRDLEFEHRLRMPDQSVKYLHVVAHATRDHDGQLEYIGAVQDVTERRRSEDALSKVRSELAHMARVTTLGALTASIAHEVNQPLSGIITNASTSLLMLADDPPDIAGALEAAQRTIRDANRASEVIARLRALFKKTSIASESLDLNEATREVLALSLSELQRAQVIVRTELADDLPPVRGDRVQLQQVVLNLVLNAAEAMSAIEDRPQAAAWSEPSGTRVTTCVSRCATPDLGSTPRSANRLFETFYTTKRDGMGIGLSISRSIIESHQGRLWAAPNDGPGATFAFSIPRLPGSAVPAMSTTLRSPAVPDVEGVRGRCVMVTRSLVSVVDDDESVRESLPAPAQDIRLCGASVFVCRRVSRVGVRRPDEVPDSRHRDAGDERARASDGIVAPSASDSDCLHHGSRRRHRPSPRARGGCRGMPVQAVQRDRTASRGQYGPSSG